MRKFTILLAALCLGATQDYRLVEGSAVSSSGVLASDLNFGSLYDVSNLLLLDFAPQSVTVNGATTFAVTSSYVTLACTGAETINTITGGTAGLIVYLENTDTECTIADDDDVTAANAIDLIGTATSDVGAVNKVITLLYTGTYWVQTAEPVTAGWVATATSALDMSTFAINFGTDPADSGDIALENNTSICWEAAPAGTDECVKFDASENFVIDGPLVPNGASDPADSGDIRLGNLQTLCWERATPGADVCALYVDANNETQYASTGPHHFAGSQLRAPAGSAGTPGYGFAPNSQDTGMYTVATDELGFTVGGGMKVHLDSGGVEILVLEQADLTATCTLGMLKYDTGGAIDELCYCQATDTWMCAAVAAGPSD